MVTGESFKEALPLRKIQVRKKSPHQLGSIITSVSVIAREPNNPFSDFTNFDHIPQWNRFPESVNFWVAPQLTFATSIIEPIYVRNRRYIHQHVNLFKHGVSQFSTPGKIYSGNDFSEKPAIRYRVKLAFLTAPSASKKIQFNMFTRGSLFGLSSPPSAKVRKAGLGKYTSPAYRSLFTPRFCINI